MQHYARHYQTTQLMTASPGELLLLTYQGLLRFLRQAAEAMPRHDLFAQSEALAKAQNLLLYLASTLNYEADSELCRGLYQTYCYLVDRLTVANLNDDIGALEEVIGHVTQLYQAWEEAEAIVRGATGRVDRPAAAPLAGVR